MLDPKFENLLRQHLKDLPAAAALDEEHSLQSYGLDSLAAVNLLLEIENTYDIIVPDKYLVETSFSTARFLWNIVQGLRNGEIS